MTTAGPFPRSLDPLPGEYLPGYLLRLAHRLDLSPFRIAQLAGLTTSALIVAVESGLSLDLPSRQRFAETTRLTDAEVASLLLLHQTDRYLPVRTSTAGTQRRLRGIAQQEPWLFTRFTRYCPQCLAGDGTAMQRAHGGPWQTRWRLPVVFACAQHQRLLNHQCPACRQSAFASNRAGLVPSATVTGLYPAQCRTPAATVPGQPQGTCGTRLDSTPEPDSGKDRTSIGALLTLQHKILDLLDAHGSATTSSAGHPVAPELYFANLRVVATLISASWPTLSDAVAHLPLHDALDVFLRRRHEEITARRQHKARPPVIVLHDRPPEPADACAALIAAADHLLTRNDPASLNRHVRQMADAAPIGAAWNRRISAIRHELSPGLNTALEPILSRFAVTPRPGKRRPPARKANFDHRHIPQRLPDAWFGPFFGRLPTAGAGQLRRVAAISLVHLVTGGTRVEARRLLGMPDTFTSRTTMSTAWLRDNADAFTHALQALADHLDADTKLVDYGNRRQQLANWSIPAQQWTETVREHAEPTSEKSIPPDWGDFKRRYVSWMVWITVTSGERRLAPPSILPAVNDRELVHDRHRIVNYWHTLRRTAGPHPRQLAKIIDRYTEQTISAIDARS
jgi:hypothetical protein